MSEEDQHVNKRSTGTVPKQRIRYTRSVTEVDRLRSLSNSSSDYYHDSYNELRSPRRSNQVMDPTLQAVSPVQIGSININSVGSSNPSSTTSRKNSLSSTLKCDNMIKHPNKKQIEDKLNQIHEYLKVTNSLMASIKKVDNQVLGQNDDSAIESDYSSKKNDGNSNLENLSFNLVTLKEHDPTSLLQRKSENKCLSPRQNRSNLLLEVCNHKNSTSNRSNRSDIHHDGRYNENDEKNRRLHPNPQLIPTQDKTSINLEPTNMPNINEINDTEQLFDALDFNDAELAIQHDELHKKIVELQNKKFQIDQFLAQLQSSSAHGEDVEHQMMKIGAMKAQLKKLGNMLEFVKMPLNSNNSPDYEKASCYLCSTTDNISEKIKSRHHHNESNNIFRSASHSCIDSRPNQLNKNTVEKSKIQPAKPSMSSITQKTTLQTELESKKRELVEIMGKHKVNSSNLNQDLGLDTKSDISFLLNGINDPWASVISNDSDSDRFSSDEYQNEINDKLKHNFLPSPKFSPSTMANSQTENVQRSNFEFRPVNRTPEANRSNSAGNATYKNKSQLSNSQELHTSQMQKQLEIIRSICDSMLEHQNKQETYSNTQHFQNNQIHSSQRFTSSSQQRNSRRNSDNTINSEIHRQWLPSNAHNNSNNFRQDNNNASYYNWLSTNNIQTQSFMLNTLNQCYQMLWMQQKELAVLKNSISMLQERFKDCNFKTSADVSSAPPHANSHTPPDRHLQQQNLEHKPNQDVYSMPISNHFECPHSGIYFNSANNNNSQLIDSCLNNITLNRLNADQNSEHGIPGSMNHMMPNHIWSGQALNNQVVPGNRANNYWDNFRSYSRQNLLSTKNSEVLQNIPTVVDRPNFINHCANPFAFMSFSKSNSEQDSTNTSQDNTFQRIHLKETNPGINLGTQSTASEVKINDTVKNNEELESPSKDIFHKDNINSHFGLPLAVNLRSNHEDCFNDFSVSEEFFAEKPKRTDQINKSTTEEGLHLKSTFEDMKENIYKEVASLISANENRPQFLIQLFRDLQLVKSDNVRENVLHSIERNIYISHVTPGNQSTQTNPSTTYLQSTSPMDLNISHASFSSNEYIICKSFLQDTQQFLELHEECIIQNNFFISLKDFLLNLQSFKGMFKDTSYHIDLINIIIDDDLQKYCGKRLGDVKPQLLQRICDLVFGRRIINLDDEINCKMSDPAPNIVCSDGIINRTENLSNETRRTPANGDLAEADQSRTVNEDFTEEGAVGGILETSEIIQNDKNPIIDSLAVCLTNPTQSESTNREIRQPVEDTELLEIQNNALFLDH